MAAGAYPPPLPLFNHLVDEPKRVRVLHQSSHLVPIKAGWNLGVDFQTQGHFAAGQRSELLDNRFNNLAHFMGRSISGNLRNGTPAISMISWLGP